MASFICQPGSWNLDIQLEWSSKQLSAIVVLGNDPFKEFIRAYFRFNFQMRIENPLGVFFTYKVKVLARSTNAAPLEYIRILVPHRIP